MRAAANAVRGTPAATAKWSVEAGLASVAHRVVLSPSVEWSGNAAWASRPMWERGSAMSWSEAVDGAYAIHASDLMGGK